MARTLTDSLTDRKNILNNPYAINHIENEVGMSLTHFEGQSVLTLKEVADFFEVEIKTINRYIVADGFLNQSSTYPTW